MTVALGLLAALATEFAAGFGLTVFLLKQRLTITEHVAVAWLLGTAVISLALWLSGFVLHGLVLQGVVTIFTVWLGVAGVARYRKLPALVKRPFISATEILFWVILALELAAVVVLSLQHTLGWDGLTVWELKARYAFLNQGVIPSQYFSDPARQFSHPEYPLLLPLTETWLYLWLGDCDQFWVKLLFPIWYCAGVLMLLVAAQYVAQRRWIGWLTVLLFPLVPAIHSAPGGAAVGYADVPLGAIYIAALFYLLRYLAERSGEALVLCLALSATLPWMKREGAVLWSVLAIFAAATLWQRQARSFAVLFLLPGALVLAGWKIFCAVEHTLPSRDFVGVGLQTFFGNIGRSGKICREVYLTLTAMQLWDIFWLLTLVALVAALVRCRNSVTLAVCWSVVVPLGCYSATYLFSAWPNYVAHIDTSFPRLLIQLTPAAWLAIALACRFTSPGPPGQQRVWQSARGTDCN